MRNEGDFETTSACFPVSSELVVAEAIEFLLSLRLDADRCLEAEQHELSPIGGGLGGRPLRILKKITFFTPVIYNKMV